MASREMQLLSRIVTSGDLNTVIDWGITPDDFLSLNGRAMFNHIVGYYSRKDSAGSVIGPQLMSQLYPSFIPCDDPGMTTKALCSEVRKTRFAIEGTNKLDQLRPLFDIDPIAAINQMQADATEMLSIGFGKDTDMSLGTAFDKELARYQLLEDGVDLSCGPWPWPIMNEATGGFQPDDYIVFYGRPKSFKSWVLAYIISWIFNNDKRAIIYTKEMTPENIFRRVISCIAEVNYDGLRMGRLTPEEKYALYAARNYMNALQASNNLYCLSGKDAPAGGDTVPWLRSKAKKFKPDYIFIDGVYLMSDVRKHGKENERVKSISRDLSDLRLDIQTPIVVTIQANRHAAKNEEANLDEVAFSDALSQDATCIIRVINEKNTPTCQLVLGGSREYALNGFRINAKPATNFTFHSTLTEKEIDKAKRQDTPTEDNPNAYVKKKKSSAAVTSVVNRIPS